MQVSSDSKYSCRTGDFWCFHPGYFGHAALGGKIAFEYSEVALRIHGVFPLPDYVLILTRRCGNSLQYFRHSLTTYGHAIAVQQAMFEQHLHYLRNASRFVQVGSNIPAGGLQIAQHRHLAAHTFKIINSELTSAAWAMARKCNTALVEPPTAMITAIAFSIDFRVITSRGRICFLIASTSTSAERAALTLFRHPPLPSWKSKAGSSPSLRMPMTWYWR